MIRYLAFGLLVVLTLALVVREGLSDTSPESSVDLVDVLIQKNRVEQQWSTQWKFRELLDSTLHHLVDGEISLFQATMRVSAAAEFYSPCYLSMIPRSDPGKSIHESIARNLIGHIQSRSSSKSKWNERLPALEMELEETLVTLERTSLSGVTMP